MRWPIALLVLWFALFVPATMRGQAPSAPVPTPQTSSAKPIAPQESSSIQSNPDVQVWVNTHSGIYHCPNTHWYGATKSGVYMKQLEAQQKGYRAAYHRVCR